MGLFNEAEQDQPDDAQRAENDETERKISLSQPPRRKAGRKPIPGSLPRVRVEHDLANDQKVCQSCGNTDLHRIGEEVSEQLEIIPATVQVLQHVRPKYGCRCCEAGPVSSPMPPQPIPGSIASPGLLTQIIVAKYQDGLPLYRLEKLLVSNWRARPWHTG